MSHPPSNIGLIQFINWQPLKKLTFLAVGNYFKLQERELENANTTQDKKLIEEIKRRKEIGMSRSEVYEHVKLVKSRLGLPFIWPRMDKDKKKSPTHKMFWTYVNQLKDEGYLMMTISERAVRGKRRQPQYSFRMTEKGEELFKNVSFAMNFGLNEAARSASDDPKEQKRIREEYEKRLRDKFPFTASRKMRKRFQQT